MQEQLPRDAQERRPTGMYGALLVIHDSKVFKLLLLASNAPLFPPSHLPRKDAQFPSMKDREIYSVSQLNREARAQLEGHFPLTWVEGEISNLAKPRSGHIYFTLKDEFAQVRCAMFRMRATHLRFTPKEGQHVVIRVRVSLYENRGDFQLITESMEELGSGALQRAFEDLKQRLQTEQLFAQERKKRIPEAPQTIGVVTSPSGAAVRDILSVLARRNPSIKVIIYPTTVQGEVAASEIVHAIETANRRAECDLLIIGRGGGSLEDLWPFNEERVARAIAASTLPTVSAVGHEVDLTIADLVADLRAPTPSAAAELVTHDREESLQYIEKLLQRIKRAIRSDIQLHSSSLQSLSRHLKHPQQHIFDQAQRLDELEARLQRTNQHTLLQGAGKLNALSSRLNGQRPALRISQSKVRLSNLWGQLQRGIGHRLEHKQLELAKAAQGLDLVSPLATLQRGYSITLTDNSEVVSRADKIKIGESITTKLATGELTSQVTSIKK
ncbi:MAG: exodeoxyribonuclease VII large subunit [Chromatiales bacterium]|nr:exodeoxyribonuclease VII large subunit [Chromatiales bacterium]